MAEFGQGAEDAVAWPIMARLAACIETTLKKRGLPGVCRSIPVPGPIAVVEACGNCNGDCTGQAWVRLSSEFPYTIFPQPEQSGGRCETNRAVVLEVGIARCLHTGQSNGVGGYTPPSNAEVIADARLQMADKAAMVEAIRCCVGDDDFLDYALGAYAPMQISADCGGGYWLVTIG